MGDDSVLLESAASVSTSFDAFAWSQVLHYKRVFKSYNKTLYHLVDNWMLHMKPVRLKIFQLCLLLPP
ncbi:unnamed protein product [Peronospora effusa]|nr:unnamed protein product [Peronospora effusa]